jgi:hypothetical protein
MTNTEDRVRDLLHEAGETHHIVFRQVDGVDDDWASRYSEWLIDHSELPDILGTRPGEKRTDMAAGSTRQGLRRAITERAMGLLVRAATRGALQPRLAPFVNARLPISGHRWF